MPTHDELLALGLDAKRVRGAKLPPGRGFTHKPGDLVTVSADKLGALTNRMRHAHDCPPWDFGAGALMRNLAKRGLL